MLVEVAIDEDVLTAAQDLADRKGCPLGAVLSDLARQSLPPPPLKLNELGIAVLPRRRSGIVVTNEMIDRLREDEGI